MADLGNRCPYEVVTGLQPKMPVAMVAESGREFLPVTEYVVQLQAYMRDTYQAASVCKWRRTSVSKGPFRVTCRTSST